MWLYPGCLSVALLLLFGILWVSTDPESKAFARAKRQTLVSAAVFLAFAFLLFVVGGV
jgi:hypothetical protein